MDTNVPFLSAVTALVDFEIQLEMEICKERSALRYMYVGGVQAQLYIESHSDIELDSFGNSILIVYKGVHPSAHLVSGTSTNPNPNPNPNPMINGYVSCNRGKCKGNP